MNINDVKEEVNTEGKDKLEIIFDRQKELAEKYDHIEEASGIGIGILNGGQFDINEKRSQALCKDFAWRITEELTESYEALSANDIHHAKEELADSLHFMVELLIKCGMGFHFIKASFKNTGRDVLDDIFKFYNNSLSCGSYWEVTFFLGKAMNCLKQKPWKQTHVLTDEFRFRQNLIDSFFCIISVAKYLGMNSTELLNYYFKKSKVNEFRQESKY